MKKSNKGFTLIELLASMVILGLLFGLAIPQLVGLVGRNRNKMYVADARKLLSQAEYRVKKSSTTIEKPELGNCIVMSLVYLESTDFDVAPNKGEYLKDYSYVVIKNNDGTLEYSATIVEELKDGGYKGILLTKSDVLNSSDAVKQVTNIKKSQLIKAKELSESDINNRLKPESGVGNYITSIEQVYNDPELDDKASKSAIEAPVIVKAMMASTTGKSYNSLDATLTLTATDPDTASSDLTVYISTTGYDDSGEGYAYGDKNSFTHDFKFGSTEYGFDYVDGGTVSVYIIVKDKQNNEDRTTITYDIHKNSAPVIDETASGFSKLPTDKVNRTTALFTLSVSDDIESQDDLKICFIDDPTDESECKDSDYKTWKETFTVGNNQSNYEFSSNKCDLNGQEKTVRVFVKDKLGKTSYQDFKYVIANDKEPVISSIKIESEKESFLNENTVGGSLNTKVTVVGSDEVSYDSSMQVKISEAGSEDKTVNPFVSGNAMSYTLNGSYDGTSKIINVTLIDECGNSTTKQAPAYQLYKNTPPTISNIVLESDGYACPDGNICPLEDGYSQHAMVYFNISDDLDKENLREKVLICMGESKADCSKNSDFKPYLEYVNGHEFTFNENKEKPYTGEKKKLYIAAKDSSGAMSEKYSSDYPLYKNKKPEITDFKVESIPNDFTSDKSLETNITFSVKDDLDNYSDLKYTIGAYDENGLHLERSSPQSLAEFNELIGIDYTVGSYYENNELKNAFGYDGKAHKIVLTVYDSYSGTSGATAEKDYEVYKNQPPHIFTTIIQDKIDEEDDGGEGETTSDDTTGESNGDDELESIVIDGVSIIPKNEDCHENYLCPYLVRNDTVESSIECPGETSESKTYTVRYVRGDHGTFTERRAVFNRVKEGNPTPKYTDSTAQQDAYGFPTGETNWVFTKWSPDFSPCVSDTGANGSTITYTAQWAEDKNHNGIADDDEGENANAEIIFDVEDDMDSPMGKDLYVCFAEEDENATTETNRAKCEQKIKCEENESIGDCVTQGKYVKYNDFIAKDDGGWERKFNFNNGIYNGDIRKLYVYALDSNGDISSVSQTYKLYKNKAPEIVKRDEKTDSNGEIVEEKTPNIVSKVDPVVEEIEDGAGNTSTVTTSHNSKQATFSLEATDDFDMPVNLKVNVCYQCVANCGSEDNRVHCYDDNDNDNIDNYVDYDESYNIEFPALAGYNGQKYKVFAKVKDSLGGITTMAQSDYLEYQLYKDVAPKIVSVDATYENARGITSPSTEGEEEEEVTSCPGESGNAEYKIVYAKGTHGVFTENEIGKTVYNNQKVGSHTPGYNGETVTYDDNLFPKGDNGWVFTGWSPSLKLCINAADADSSKTITYTAQWEEDSNNNGVADIEEEYEATGITRGSWESTSNPKLIVSVEVDDPFDTYTLCISQSENQSSCPASSYVGKDSSGTAFSADDLKSGIVYYVKNNKNYLKYYTDTGKTFTEYHVFVKDSYGHVSTTSFLGNKYEECGVTEKGESEYHPVDEDDKISASVCNGRCYFATASMLPYKTVNGSLVYDDGDEDSSNDVLVLLSDRMYDTSGTTANYTRKISYSDKFKSETSCEGAQDDVAETKNCSFITCFENPNHVESDDSIPKYMKAIGLTKRRAPRMEVYTENVNGVDYSDDEYYWIYEVSYDQDKGVAILNRTNQKVLVNAYNSNPDVYEYNSDNDITYVRVMD